MWGARSSRTSSTISSTWTTSTPARRACRACSPIAGNSTVGGYNAFFGPGGLGNLSFANNGATLGQEATTPWTDDQKHWTLLARLDWAVNTENHLSLRMNSQEYKGLNHIYAGVRQSNRATSAESTMKYGSTSWVAEWESTLGPDIINDARLQLATESRPTTPNSTLPSLGMPGFNAGGYYIDPRRTDETTRQVMDTATYVQGDWTVKAGIDWQWLHFRNQFYPDARGSSTSAPGTSPTSGTVAEPLLPSQPAPSPTTRTTRHSTA